MGEIAEAQNVNNSAAEILANRAPRWVTQSPQESRTASCTAAQAAILGFVSVLLGLHCHRASCSNPAPTDRRGIWKRLLCTTWKHRCAPCQRVDEVSTASSLCVGINTWVPASPGTVNLISPFPFTWRRISSAASLSPCTSVHLVRLSFFHQLPLGEAKDLSPPAASEV